MYRIRFHGRGGEGMKTSSRILGTSFYLEGFHVQDAPRYGAERRGAPVFAYVRADNRIINERGVIHKPDLIIIADDTLLKITPEAVLEGATPDTVIFIITSSDPEQIKESVFQCKKIIHLAPEEFKNYRNYLSTICAAGSAQLTGKISFDNIARSVEEELESLNKNSLNENLEIARSVFEKFSSNVGVVSETPYLKNENLSTPDLINLPFAKPSVSTPAIRVRSTSLYSQTGTWRIIRPVINKDKCSRCMICNVYCPDSVISVSEDGFPEIDYVHCKGCLICAEICPSHAIEKHGENQFGIKGGS